MVREYRLQELVCENRVLAIKSGLASVVPLHVLTILNPRDLEMRVCGIPNVDVDFLKVGTFLGQKISVYFVSPTLSSFTPVTFT